MSQIFSTTIENNKRRNETSLQIYRAFEQLKQSLVNGIDPTQSFAPETIFSQLNQIFCRLSDRDSFTAEDVLDLFEIILANYLDLLASDQLLNLIEHRYAYINNVIFTPLFDSIVAEDIAAFTKSIPFEACQKRYHRLLKQLLSSQRLLSYLGNVRSATSNFSRSILFLIFRCLNSLNVTLLDIELRKYQNSLFVPLLAFLDEHFQTNEHPENNPLLEQILIYIRAITVETLTIPIFINAQYPQACLRWLTRSSMQAREYTYILHILCHIALHDEGMMVLNEHQCKEKLVEFQSTRLDTQIDFLIDEKWYKILQLTSFILTMTLAHPNELNRESIRQSLAQYMIPALSNNILARSSGGSIVHTSQLMIVLMKLLTNDEIIPCFVKDNSLLLVKYALETLNFLLHCVTVERTNGSLLSLDVLAVIAVANILWSLSFHERYRAILLVEKALLQRLVSFQSSDILTRVFPSIYIPRQMSSLKRAIDGIQHNLDPPSIVQTVLHSSTKCCVMLSYSHINVDLCQRLYHLLNTVSEITLTVDFLNSDYLWKEKRQMLEQSDVILFLISEDFLYSRSCRQELIYGIDTLKKPYIPVYLNRSFQPPGWLRQRIADSQPIIVDEDDLTRVSDEIFTFIRERFSLKMSKSADIQQWNHTDVKQWFTDNKLVSKLHQFYDFKNGRELLSYAHAILPYQWTDEYKRISSKFTTRFQPEERLSPYDFSKFFDALQRLNQSSTSLSLPK